MKEIKLKKVFAPAKGEVAMPCKLQSGYSR